MSYQKQTVKERPIIFSSESVRAILEGLKTQTRRVVTKSNSTIGSLFQSAWSHLNFDDVFVDPGGTVVFGPGPYLKVGMKQNDPWVIERGLEETRHRVYPRIQPGDLLWVRERWASSASLDHVQPRNLQPGFPCEFQVGGCSVSGYEALVDCGRWRPSIYMPRWASRITLEVIDERVEQVQDISEWDAIEEGVEVRSWDLSARVQFKELWDSLNAKRGYSWESNSWVWVVEFKRAQDEHGAD